MAIRVSSAWRLSLLAAMQPPEAVLSLLNLAMLGELEMAIRPGPAAEQSASGRPVAMPGATPVAAARPAPSISICGSRPDRRRSPGTARADR